MEGSEVVLLLLRLVVSSSSPLLIGLAGLAGGKIGLLGGERKGREQQLVGIETPAHAACATGNGRRKEGRCKA